MDARKVPMRQCTGCREMKEKRDLIRVIRTDDDRIMIDTGGRMNGRGAYICRDISCLEKANKSRGLERSLKKAVPADVYEELKKELMRIEE